MKRKIAVTPAIAYSISILLFLARAQRLAFYRYIAFGDLLDQAVGRSTHAYSRSAAFVKPHIRAKKTITTTT
jgi:hypothetical protein